MIRAVTLCVVSAAAGAAAMALMIHSGNDDWPGNIVQRFVTGDSGVPGDSGVSTSGSGNRDRAQFAPARPSPGATATPESVADQLVRLAATDPRGAMLAAQQLPGHWHRLDTFTRIVTSWARREPTQPLTYVQESFRFDPVTERRLLASAFAEWAAIEPGNVLNYLLTQRGQRLLFDERNLGASVLREIAVSRPAELLGAAGNLPRGPVRSSMRTAAIESLIERDLELAVRQATSEASTMDRTQWTLAITEYLTQQAPAGALEQARELDREFPGMLTDVAFRLATFYPETLVSLNLCEISPDVSRDCQQ